MWVVYRGTVYFLQHMNDVVTTIYHPFLIRKECKVGGIYIVYFMAVTTSFIC